MRNAFYALAIAFVIFFAEVDVAQLLAAPPIDRDLPYGCLIVAAEFQADYGLRQHGVWSRIIGVTWQGRGVGHVLCVYSLRNGDLWAYDSRDSSVSLQTRDRNLSSVLKALRKFHDRRIYSARWID